MRQLVWFRSDLRVRDNTALHHACRAARDARTAGVVGLFVLSPAEWKSHDYAPARIDLMRRTLRVLSDDLWALNIPLLVTTARRAADVPRLVADTAIRRRCAALHFNREYEVDESRRDEAVTRLLREHDIAVTAHTDQVCFEPGAIRTGEGRYYTVFTPFRRAWTARYVEAGGLTVLPTPARQANTGISPSDVPDDVEGFKLRDDTRATLTANWPGGEQHATKQLRRFLRTSIQDYKKDRDIPAHDGTSRLSPYLAIGAISPRMCIEAAVKANVIAKAAKPRTSSRSSGRPGLLDGGSPGVMQWIGELIWREFYVCILAGFPRVCMGRPFRPATERIRWSDNDDHFEAWKAGKTGVPIVDAGMRQLRAEGWMHNRLRMVTAMYLTKNLLIDWRRGERWFMQNLVDGFFASNNGGWQWSASTGTDAAPYFRVFNPVSQGKKFDPDGEYVRRYVPELRSVPGAEIHEPWRLPGGARHKLAYPSQLVDLGESRRRAIAAFRAIKS